MQAFDNKGNTRLERAHVEDPEAPSMRSPRAKASFMLSNTASTAISAFCLCDAGFVYDFVHNVELDQSSLLLPTCQLEKTPHGRALDQWQFSYSISEELGDVGCRDGLFQKVDVIVLNIIEEKQLLGKEPRVEFMTEFSFCHGDDLFKRSVMLSDDEI